jgi:protein-S-isoprenylcysteine O-methyltransferase Ste14
MHPLELKVPPPVMLLVAIALIWVADRLFPALSAHSVLSAPLTMLLAVAGIALGIAGVWEFRRAQTTVNPHHPEQTSAIVTSGIYARTRNPMYLGLTLLVAAAAAWYGNLIGGLIVPLFVLYINRFQIVPEERTLNAKFGVAFRDYCGKVRRWI